MKEGKFHRCVLDRITAELVVYAREYIPVPGFIQRQDEAP